MPLELQELGSIMNSLLFVLIFDNYVVKPIVYLDNLINDANKKMCTNFFTHPCSTHQKHQSKNLSQKMTVVSL